MASKEYNSEYWKKNKDKILASHREYYVANKEKISEYRKQYYAKNSDLKRSNEYKRKYGITIEQYDELLARQNNVCAICKFPCKTGRRLAVDHCHETGKIRGLLCHDCNTGIGKLKESPDLLLQAHKYLSQE